MILPVVELLFRIKVTAEVNRYINTNDYNRKLVQNVAELAVKKYIHFKESCDSECI